MCDCDFTFLQTSLFQHFYFKDQGPSHLQSYGGEELVLSG